MKTLILTFGLGLIAALQAQDLPVVEEENQDESGPWYLKAVAADREIPRKSLEPVSVTPMTVKTLEGGSMELKFTVLIRGRCREISAILEKTDEPGKYTTHGGRRMVYVIPSSVQDHYILYSEEREPRHQIRMVKLLGRDPEVNQEALADFAKVVEAKGLNADSISVPKQREVCSPESA